ncbi:MAG TPA: ABC transporter permease [Terriglobia bacterium]|jgi:phospholipid/cholesterol/gamma-HCH transport system permease protein
MELLLNLGAATERALAYIGGLAQLLGRAFAHAVVSPLKRSMSLRRANHQAMAVGVSAIPVISFIAFFIGVIMALQGAYELKRFGAIHLIADMVAISITRELGPLVTAIVVVGRSGSAFAAEIGTMKVTEELDAIETMALHPIAFLVTPKLLAMLVMMPCLTIWADLMGVLGGSAFGMIGANYTFGTYLAATRDALFMRDVITGLIKSVVFGLVITGVGCQEGFSTGAGSEQVGRSTTSAVVTSIFLVVFVDLIFTTIFYITSGT